MAERFDYFVIFAEMRTGSNVLERNLQQLDDINMFGEAYNPDFIGDPSWPDLFGISFAERQKTPDTLIENIRKRGDHLHGFRYFHDHDPRIVDRMLQDPRCGKVVLTRSALDSHISIRLATKADQWILTDYKDQVDKKVYFEMDKFETFLTERQGFQLKIQRALQTTGQTAFYMHYDDINDIEVLNGLAQFLGVEGRVPEVQDALKPQNRKPMKDKVENYDQMLADLGKLDLFDLTRTPSFEPRRGPSVPGYVAGSEVPLLFMPMTGGPNEVIEAWLAALDRDGPEALMRDFTQKTLRQWKKEAKGHRTFSVLPHPVDRVHRIFCSEILPDGDESRQLLRTRLREGHGIALPDAGAPWSLDQHRTAFLAFLTFLRANLAGQTGLHVHRIWATQTVILQGYGEFAPADILIRESRLTDELRWLGASVDRFGIEPGTMLETAPYTTQDVYNGQIEQAVRQVYGKDYTNFGFLRWNSD